MIKVHVIYQWYLPTTIQRLIKPLDTLKEAGTIEVSYYGIFEYKNIYISNADVIIFSNIISPDAIVIATEARLKGIRLIYDESIESEANTLSSNFLRTYYYDVRAQNVRDRLLRMVDLVISSDKTIVERHPHIRQQFNHIENVTHEWLYEILKTTKIATYRESDCKKIFFISPTFMWPHQYISDLMVEELMRMGHDVYLFTVKPSYFLHKTVCKPSRFENSLLKVIEEYAEDAWKIPLLIDRFEPDLVLTIQGYVIPRQVLAEIRSRNLPFVVWFLDEPFDAIRSCSYGRYFTHVFLQDKASLMYHRHFGNPNSFYLPYAAAPDISKRFSEQPGEQPRYKVHLVGSPSEKRLKLIEKLQSAGIEVTVAGCGWTGAEKGVNIVQPRSYNEVFNLYRQSLINISLGDTKSSPYNPSQLQPYSPDHATFNIAASCGFHITDISRAGITECFVPDKEIVQFTDLDDCVEKVRYYLEHTDEMEAIAASAFERVCNEHTYRHRIEAILKTVEENEIQRNLSFHYSIGYVQFESEAPGSVEQLPPTATLTVITERPSKNYIDNKMRLIHNRPEKGFASAVNTAILNSPSDYIVISHSSLWRRHREILSLVSAFSNDLLLGMIVLKDRENSDFAGLIIPVRVLLSAGSFKYKNAEYSFLDIRYRMEEMGYSVIEHAIDSSPVSKTAFSLAVSEDERTEFIKEWTDNPEKKINAHKILNLLIENNHRFDKKEALYIIKRSLELCPDLYNAHSNLAKIYLTDGNITKAIQHLEYVWNRKPEDVKTGLLFCIALIMQKDFDRASNILDSILNSELHPSERASALYQKGLLLKKLNRLEDAVEHFLLALRIDPSHTNTLKELSLAYLELGETEETIHMMKARLSFMVTAETLNDVGALYWVLGDREVAYQWFVKALELDPKFRSAVLNAVTAGLELGRNVDEIKDFLIGYLNYYPGDAEMWRIFESIK